MRKQQLLRASSAQSLCIFCQCRLIAEFPTPTPAGPLGNSRRRLNTSQRSRQVANATGAPIQPDRPPSSQSTWTGFDPTSSLSASEQRERELLRQRREEQLQKARDLEEQQRKRQQIAADAFAHQREQEKKADEVQRRTVQEQWRKEQEAIAAKLKQDGQKKSRRLNQGGQAVSGGAEQAPASGRGLRVYSDDSTKHQESQPYAQGSTRRALRNAQSTRQQQADRRNNPFAVPQYAKQSKASLLQSRLPPPAKVPLPAFIRGVDKATEPERSSAGGWGSGRAERPPLIHEEGKETSGVASQVDHAEPSKGEEMDIPSDRLRESTTARGTTPLSRQSSQSPTPASASRNPLWSTSAFEQEIPRYNWTESSSTANEDGAQLSERRSQQQVSQYVDRQEQESTGLSYHKTDGQLVGKGAPYEALRGTQKTPSGERVQRGGDEYHATILDATEYRQTLPPVDDAHTGEWQHLRRKGDNRVPPPVAERPHNQATQQWDDSAIDRIFNEHRAQRQQPVRYDEPTDFIPSAPSKPANGPYVRKSGDRRCGRCGEIGHLARDCNGPIRANCNLCGEPGHFARTCPERTNKSATGSNVKRPFKIRGTSQRTDVEPWTAQQDKSQRAQFDDPFTEPAATDRSQPIERKFGLHALDTTPSMERGQSAIADVRQQVSSAGVVTGTELREDQGEDEEQPAERVLRSRKFTDEGPRREKAPRRGGRDEDEGDDESGAARDERNARKAARKAEKARKSAKEAEKRAVKARKAEQGIPINLPEFVSVATLAQTLGVRYESFVSRLQRLGYDDVFPGKVLNSEISGMIAMEYNFEPVFESAADEAEERDLKARPPVEDKEFLPTRPPVVTIMGHVDHGKTTILDYLRKSSVAAGEAGGITQHIGAFSVPLASSGKTITFLDTPGHAAFLAMRQRGANVTDIVILVVAADDSVKPQTLEAIRHAKAAGVPMIVAVNKIDKEGADVQRVKQDLARHGVEIEDFGGDTQVVCVSGKTGEGMDELEEAAVTLSEILDHRAETNGIVEGWVLEATTKKAGRVATVLVRQGTLKVGTIIVAGKTWARVRTLRNEGGVVIQSIGPGLPVEVDGWRDQPAAGDEVLQAPSEQKANDVVDFRLEKEEREKTATDMEAINDARRIEQEKREKEKMASRARQSNDEDPEAAAESTELATVRDTPTGRMEVPFIIKADVSGSAEAVAAYILSISSPLIFPRILRSTVGGLNESDVELAATAEGHIIAFNLPADEGMKGQAEARGVKVLENNIIYRVLDDVKAVLEDKLPPIVTQKVVGEAEISAAFEISVGGRKKLKIAGCKVRNGVINRGSRVRILRGDQKIFDGTIDSLKNVKKDVQEMRKGSECGMGFGDWEAFEVGDQVQTYEETSERRKL